VRRLKTGVSEELRRAFAVHPDLRLRPKAEREERFAAFGSFADGGGSESSGTESGGSESSGTESSGTESSGTEDDGFRTLERAVAALQGDLGLPPGAVDTAAGWVQLPQPALFLRFRHPLAAAVVDACGSGSYAHRQHPWVMRACFADPDQEPAGDFPYLFGPEKEHWRDDEAGCRMDAWRIAFGVWLFARRGPGGRPPRPETREAKAEAPEEAGHHREGHDPAGLGSGAAGGRPGPQDRS
jgi:hypothetical protein